MIQLLLLVLPLLLQLIELQLLHINDGI